MGLKGVDIRSDIGSRKYKDFDFLKQFESLIKELLAVGLIAKNGLPNHYEANAYDCTTLGDEILKAKKTESVNTITKMVSSTAGHVIGAILSEVC